MIKNEALYNAICESNGFDVDIVGDLVSDREIAIVSITRKLKRCKKVVCSTAGQGGNGLVLINDASFVDTLPDGVFRYVEGEDILLDLTPYVNVGDKVVEFSDENENNNPFKIQVVL